MHDFLLSGERTAQGTVRNPAAAEYESHLPQELPHLSEEPKGPKEIREGDVPPGHYGSESKFSCSGVDQSQKPVWLRSGRRWTRRQEHGRRPLLPSLAKIC
jgi:hypothetical protein